MRDGRDGLRKLAQETNGLRRKSGMRESYEFSEDWEILSLCSI
jgi:hypothetical protein